MASAGDMWMRWRVRIGYPVAVLYAVLARPTVRSIAMGAAIALVGLVIRALAAGHLRKHEALATSGPYAYTRNPLYLGSAFLAAGMLVAGWSWIAAAVVVVYFALSYPPVMRREERELRVLYGAAFDQYATHVPLFWPRLTAASSAGQGFSWQLYKRNREYRAAVGAVLAVLLLWGKMLWLR